MRNNSLPLPLAINEVEAAQSWYLLVHHQMVVNASAGPVPEHRVAFPVPPAAKPRRSDRFVLGIRKCWQRILFSLQPNFPSVRLLYLLTLKSLDVQTYLPLVFSSAVLLATRARRLPQRPPPALFRTAGCLTPHREEKMAALPSGYTWGLLGAKQDYLQRAGKEGPSHSPGSPALWHRTPEGTSVLQKVPS